MRMRYAVLFLALLVSGCATGQKSPVFTRVEEAKSKLRLARGKIAPIEERAADYVEAAALTESLAKQSAQAHGDGLPEAAQARAIYNTSAAELTELLRSGDGGRDWNCPLRLQTGQGTYFLTTVPGKTKAFWSPGYFTSLVPADRIAERHVRKPNRQEGLGGAMVGVRRLAKREPFSPRLGFAAPVTSTLNFQGNRVRLELRNPVEEPVIALGRDKVPLEADFSAPLALHPPVHELIDGLRAMIRVEKYMSGAGLYFLEPYDPDKIPVIFVHGLMSTGHMWTNVANEINADPELRRHYQVWIFGYPTGNPVAYSALRLREELAKVDRLYAPKRGYVLVGHSMGGLLSRLQATTTGRVLWDARLKGHADEFYAKLPANNLIKRMLIFSANPKVSRLVFICVPHRGSEMALGSLGNLARKLISLPSLFTETIHTLVGLMGDSVAVVIGKEPLPTGIDSLSPRNTLLLAMDKLPIQAPYHSIIGDRGKGNTPYSSDGVVPYWSSHLAGAQSELIVPGPHSAFEMPQTVEEIKRILRVQLALQLSQK